MINSNNKSKIILFDGNCVLCNTAVNFLYSRLNETEYNFIASQSKEGELIRSKFSLGTLPDHTIVLIINDKIYTKSDAVLEISNDLPFGWRLIKLFKFVPKSIRDWFYIFISKHRYKIFGKI